MIRPLVLQELGDCEPFAKAFHEELQLPGVFSIEAFTKTWTFLLTAPTVAAVIFGLFEDDRLIGGLGAMIADDLNTGARTANEMFWFVDATHRKGSGAFRLVHEFERWGDQHDASDFRLVHMLSKDGLRFEKIYDHMGYRPIEVAYLKPNPRFLRET
ncbi:MAG: hypothetical protein Q7R68_11030 [Nitrospirales bacterium]|nr:hypothetical protein [Nitrospirales bacterium]